MALAPLAQGPRSLRSPGPAWRRPPLPFTLTIDNIPRNSTLRGASRRRAFFVKKNPPPIKTREKETGPRPVCESNVSAAPVYEYTRNRHTPDPFEWKINNAAPPRPSYAVSSARLAQTRPRPRSVAATAGQRTSSHELSARVSVHRPPSATQTPPSCRRPLAPQEVRRQQPER